MSGPADELPLPGAELRSVVLPALRADLASGDLLAVR
jgi:hypothetical protein